MTFRHEALLTVDVRSTRILHFSTLDSCTYSSGLERNLSLSLFIRGLVVARKTHITRIISSLEVLSHMKTCCCTQSESLISDQVPNLADHRPM